VGAASVNPIDTYIRSGAVAAELPRPFIVGSDLAGVVKAVGPDATRFHIGDRVWGANQGILGRQAITRGERIAECDNFDRAVGRYSRMKSHHQDDAKDQRNGSRAQAMDPHGFLPI